MDVDEIKRILRERGIPTDGWGQTREGKMEPPIISRQRDALVKMEVLLARQLESDKEQIATLHATLQRLKNGGGG